MKWRDPARTADVFSKERAVLAKDLSLDDAREQQARFGDIGMIVLMVAQNEPHAVKEPIQNPAPAQKSLQVNTSDATPNSGGKTTKAPAKKTAPKRPRAKRASTPVTQDASAKSDTPNTGTAAPNTKSNTAKNTPARKKTSNATSGKRKQAQRAPRKKVRHQKQPTNTKKRKQSSAQNTAQVASKKPAKPNWYELTPYRITQERKLRAQRALVAWRMAAGLALLFALLCVLHARQGEHALPDLGIQAVSAGHNDNLLLLVQNTLQLYQQQEQRLSVPLADLGLQAVAPPLSMATPTSVLLNGRSSTGDTESWRLYRCNLLEAHCHVLPNIAAMSRPALLAQNNLTDATAIADISNRRLYLLNAKDQIVTNTPYIFDTQAHMALGAGLLYLSDSKKQTLLAIRPDAAAFGQVLDTMRLPVSEGEQPGPLLRCGSHWWVLLFHKETGKQRLLYYDDALTLQGSRPVSDADDMACYRDSILLNSQRQRHLHRLSTDTAAPENITFSALEEQFRLAQEQGKSHEVIQRWIGRGLLSALIGSTLLGIGLWLSWRTYRNLPAKGAPPADSLAPRTGWLGAAPQRQRSLKRALVGFAAIALVLLAITGVTWSGALLMIVAWLITIGVGLWWYSDSASGNLGFHLRSLVLISPTGTYHAMLSDKVKRCGPFLMAEDIVVFLGYRGLFNLDHEQITEKRRKRIATAQTTDVGELVTRLIWSHHPLGIVLLGVALVAVVTPLLWP